MRVNDLYAKCVRFQKLAQENFDKRSYEELSSAAKEQVDRYNNFIPNQYRAQQVFNHINSIKNSGRPAANIADDLQADSWYKEAQKIVIQLEYFGQRYPNIMTGLGVNSNTLQTMLNNLKLIMAGGVSMSGYKNVALSMVKEKPFEIDEWEDERKGKKDLGF
jgi:hypothetical protein